MGIQGGDLQQKRGKKKIFLGVKKGKKGEKKRFTKKLFFDLVLQDQGRKEGGYGEKKRELIAFNK